jgi:hypothetical protein
MKKIIKKIILYCYLITIFNIHILDARRRNIKKQQSTIIKKKNEAKNKIIKKQYKTQSQYAGNVIPTVEQALEIVQNANHDGELATYTLTEINTQAIQYAKTINTELSKNEISLIKKLSPEAIKAALVMIFTATIQEAFNLTTFTIPITKETKESEEKIAQQGSEIIQDNINIISKQFNKSNVVSNISEYSDTIISIASKITAAAIQENNKLEDLTIAAKIKENNFYDTHISLEKNALFVNVLANQDKEIVKNMLAAAIILFGIKNFRTEIKKMLSSFPESTCLKTLVTASTTNPIILETAKKNSPDMLEQENLLYQKESVQCLAKIASYSKINLDMNKIIIPQNVGTGTWQKTKSFIKIAQEGMLALIAATIAYEAYNFYKITHDRESMEENNKTQEIKKENNETNNNNESEKNTDDTKETENTTDTPDNTHNQPNNTVHNTMSENQSKNDTPSNSESTIENKVTQVVLTQVIQDTNELIANALQDSRELTESKTTDTTKNASELLQNAFSKYRDTTEFKDMFRQYQPKANEIGNKASQLIQNAFNNYTSNNQFTQSAPQYKAQNANQLLQNAFNNYTGRTQFQDPR